MKPATRIAKALPAVRTHTSLQASRIVGVSLRQIQWWDEKGVLCPDVFLHRRNFTESDLQKLRFVAELRKKGLSLQKIRRFLHTFDSQRVTEFYVSDGKKLIPAVSPADAARAAAAMNRPAYVIQIQEAA